MTLLIFGVIYAFSVLAVAVVAFDEGRRRAEGDATRAYNEGHGNGFDDGWQANEQVHKSIQRMGHGANW